MMVHEVEKEKERRIDTMEFWKKLKERWILNLKIRVITAGVLCTVLLIVLWITKLISIVSTKDETTNGNENMISTEIVATQTSSYDEDGENGLEDEGVYYNVNDEQLTEERIKPIKYAEPNGLDYGTMNVYKMDKEELQDVTKDCVYQVLSLVSDPSAAIFYGDVIRTVSHKFSNDAPPTVVYSFNGNFPNEYGIMSGPVRLEVWCSPILNEAGELSQVKYDCILEGDTNFGGLYDEDTYRHWVKGQRWGVNDNEYRIYQDVIRGEDIFPTMDGVQWYPYGSDS